MSDVCVLGPSDWRCWREMRLGALAEAPDAFTSTLAEWSGQNDNESHWRGRLTAVPFNVIVCQDGVPAGMVSAVPVPHGPAVELISMWVAPFARGRGVADTAVRQVLKWAHTEYPARPVILSVMTANGRAIRLYERHGFVEVGVSADNPAERVMRHQIPMR